MINLTELNLAKNPTITDNGIADLTNLRILDLSNNEIITNSGIEDLPNLTDLISYGNVKIIK